MVAMIRVVVFNLGVFIKKEEENENNDTPIQTIHKSFENLSEIKIPEIKRATKKGKISG